MTPLPARALLFDLDGTLIDSAGDLAAAVDALLADDGLAPVGLAAVRGMIGDGIRALAARAYAAAGRPLGDAALDDRAAALLARYAADPVRATRLMPGAADALRWAAEAGLPLAIVTNKPTAVTHAILAGLNVADAFTHVIGGDSGLPRKPAPDALVVAAATLGTTPGDAVMIGDSAVDVAAARAAAMPVIAVDAGYSDRPARELAADRAIASLADLADAVAPCVSPR